MMLQLYAIRKPGLENKLKKFTTMSRLAGIKMVINQIAYGTTILNFRHLVEKHDLGQENLELVKTHDKERGKGPEARRSDRCNHHRCSGLNQKQR